MLFEDCFERTAYFFVAFQAEISILEKLNLSLHEFYQLE